MSKLPEGFDAEEAEIPILEVYHGDRYLLASDGLTDSVEEQRFWACIDQCDNRQQAAEMLAQEAGSSGASDDVTCVVSYVHSDLDQKPAPVPLTVSRRVSTIFGPTQ